MNNAYMLRPYFDAAAQFYKNSNRSVSMLQPSAKSLENAFSGPAVKEMLSWQDGRLRIHYEKEETKIVDLYDLSTTPRLRDFSASLPPPVESTCPY